MTSETNNTGNTDYPSVNLNLNVRGLTPSTTLAINELSAELIEQGRDIIKFGLGQSPFPVPRPVVEALKENAHQRDYLAVKGLRRLRDAVARSIMGASTPSSALATTCSSAPAPRS